MAKYYLGIDVGTFETKGIIINDQYKPVCTAEIAHTWDNPKPNHYEQDAEKIWWNDVCFVIKELLKKSGISPSEIASVGMDTMGCDCIAVDENCTPLRKAILYGIDNRASEEIKQIYEHFGKDTAEKLFGHALCSDDIAPKILWIQNNEPDVFDKTYKFLTGTSYLVAKMTGNYVIDRFLAKGSFMPLYDSDAKISSLGCEYFCKPSQMADTIAVNDIAGYVSEKAAEQTGLMAGTPVICGTGDSTSEAISVGITKPGKLMFQFGSSLFFFYTSDKFIGDAAIPCCSFTVPDLNCFYGGTNTAGTLTRWVKDNFYQDVVKESEANGINPFEAMSERIKDIAPGSDGLFVLPYFSGERCPIYDSDAKGIIYGLNINHTRDHIYHAALEGIAYGIDQIIKEIEKLGLPVEDITAVGGGTKNPAWMQIVADITNKAVKIPEITIGACYGEALMAALGVKDIKSFDELSSRITVKEIIMPREDTHQIYEKGKLKFAELYQNNKDMMHDD